VQESSVELNEIIGRRRSGSVNLAKTIPIGLRVLVWYPRFLEVESRNQEPDTLASQGVQLRLSYMEPEDFLTPADVKNTGVRK
jgi:hypothetical protein